MLTTEETSFFTKLLIANLGGKEIEALLDTGSTTSFIKKGILPDAHMTLLEEPLEGSGANANVFSIKREKPQHLHG